MADDDVKPRTNTGKYDESKYSPTRKAFIEKARAMGLTSAADRAKVAAMASRGPSASENIINIPDPAPGLMDPDISPSEKYRKNFNDIKWDKKAKGGLVGSSQSKGQGKVMKPKTTKHY
jgi:hypothetical protein